MPRHEQFTVELDSTPVHGRLDLPDEPEGQGPLASVLLCSGLPAVGPKTGELYDQLIDALLGAGLAVATMTGGSISSPGAKLAVESVDDAAAVFHGLSVRDELDLGRISILAHSLGGITASCLARRTDQIHRICLLAPITAHEVASRLAGDSDDELATRLGGDGVPSGYFDGIEALRPTEDLAATDRPTLIMHGAADRIAQPELSLAYRDAVASAGHQVEHVLVGRGDHLFTNSAARSACMDKVASFFAASAGTP
jgi:pimeloyl-ACP methyl ester carboxylesterase